MIDTIVHDIKRWKHRGLIVLFIPQVQATIIYRLSNLFYAMRIPVVPNILSYLNFILFGCEISPKAKIGKGLYLAHTSGVIIASTKIGENLYINSGVVLAVSGGTINEVPELGNNIFIGTGAKLLGNIKIGNNVKIGANAVVINDVPDNSTVVGVPAKIVK